jgi:hypothetical protein
MDAADFILFIKSTIMMDKDKVEKSNQENFFHAALPWHLI